LLDYVLTNSLILFQENVQEFLQGHSIESMLGALNELYSKYKYMETSFEKSKGVYKSKIPEIEQTLEIIDMMIKKRDEGEEMVTHYPLCDTLYSEAKVDTSDSKICLWVGASTMVEYSYEEGEMSKTSASCMSYR
jgi:prefoldin subunit 5